MGRKFQKTVSVLTSVTTTVWLSGVMLLVPMSVGAATVVDGDLIRNSSASGLAQFDIYIAKVVGTKKFKRLILSPTVFESYKHFDKNNNGSPWDDVVDVDQATMDSLTTSDLVRVDGDTKVYKLVATDGSDTGTKQWLNMTAAEFTASYDAESIYTINSVDGGVYTAGSDIAADGSTDGQTSTGTLSVSLAADTPAAGIAVGGAARLPFTKVNLTATGGDVVVDSIVVERTGLAQDEAISSLDVVDAATNKPINTTSKTFNSVHQGTFTDDFVVSNGTTKSILLTANMASKTTLGSYAGETPSLSLASVSVKDQATVSGTFPLTGNAQTINSTITIGSATIQRGAYTNATSTAIQVGKTDYTFFSFQIQAGSVEKVSFDQVRVYQEGSASLGTDLTGLELLQDGTKIADASIVSAKYADFSFTPITIDKGQIVQFQVRADVADGSARTVDMGVYKSTDLLVKGATYNYNITPTYSGTGASTGNPVLSDNQFTVSNGTLQVTRSNTVAAGNIAVSNNQVLGAFEFVAKGEAIDVSQLVLTVTSTGDPGNASDAILGVELVDPSGNVIAGPTDPVRRTGVVTWTDTFTVPVGTTVYQVRGDLQTSAAWASNDTAYVSFTPSAMTATGDTTGNSITATPSSTVTGNTQTVKAATLTVTRNTLPADATIIVGQKNVVLSSWNFDATASGEDIRITSVLFAGRGQSATNTDALTAFIDEDKDGVWDATDTSLSPINDAIASAAATSTFAFDDPVVITKGTAKHIALKGDKDTTGSNATENWGLGDSALSVIAYGVSTGNTVTETLTSDHGPTLTSATKGTITIESKNNPSSAIVLAGSSGNIFTNVELVATNEALTLNNLVVQLGDGSYEFNAGSGGYQDVTNVAIYDGTTKLVEAAIPSTGRYTFEFDADASTATPTVVIPKGASNGKVLTIKADMSTVDPDTDNAPGTNSADLKIGLGGINGVKTTGASSNVEITGSGFETYRSSTSSAMVLRTSKPTVTLPTAADSLGAATSLTNGSIPVYAFKVKADAAGGDVLLFRTTFVFATSGSGMTLTNVRIDDQNNNTIKTAANPTAYNIDGVNEYYYTAVFDSPDVSNGDTQEAITVPAGESRTFTVYGTITGAGTGENFSTFLVGDAATTSADVNTDNTAATFYTAPTGNLASVRSNFIWSDNYKAKSITGTGGNNATTVAQWYNGHLVSGLGNKVSTTPYVISF